MKGNLKFLLAVSILAVTALACQALNNVPGTGDPVEPTSAPVEPVEPVEPVVPQDTQVPPPTEEPSAPTGDVLFEDDFSSEQWGTGTDTDSSVEYVSDALYFVVFKENWFVWSTPNDEDYENIHAEVTASDYSTDSAATFGIMCHQQVTDSAFYYLAVTRSGKYAIVKASVALDDEILTNGGEWTESDLITAEAGSHRIGADCGNGTITLYVDGQKVDSVSDSTYTSGGVALFAWSGDTAAGTTVSFDDFVLSELK